MEEEVVFNSVVVSALKMRSLKFLQTNVVAITATIHI
jgi:hypothetical protein